MLRFKEDGFKREQPVSFFVGDIDEFSICHFHPDLRNS
jgi:hypothetical protein